MSNPHKDIDEQSGIETTGHVWDGIRELNNPLPRWWLIVFFATIVWAIGYVVMMPAFPSLPGTGGRHTPGLQGDSARANVATEVAELQKARQANAVLLTKASLQEIETNLGLQQFAMAMGEGAFGDNCATCHGAGGRGAKGYPMLADDVWLWDGRWTELSTRSGMASATRETKRRAIRRCRPLGAMVFSHRRRLMIL